MRAQEISATSLMAQQNAALGMTLFWPTALALEPDSSASFTVTPYLISSPAAYLIDEDKASPEKLFETNPFLINERNAGGSSGYGTQIFAAEIKGSLPGLYISGASENSHIIIIPDQYFISTLMNGYIGGDNGDYRNFEFLTNCLLKLNGEEELAALQSRTTRDTSLYKVTDLMQLNTLRLITFIILFIILPLMVISTGVILNVRKR